MSEEQMPARIWCDTIDAALCKEKVKRSHTSYVRADLAERMAEALSDTATLLKSFSTPDDAIAKYILDMADSALSAFRSATQDTEARHD